MKKGNYTIDNYMLDIDIFPEVTPVGTYQLLVSYQQGSKYIFGFEVLVTVTPLSG